MSGLLALIQKIRAAVTRAPVLEISVAVPGEERVYNFEAGAVRQVWRRSMCLNHRNEMDPHGPMVGAQKTYPTYIRLDTGEQTCTGFFCHSETRPLTAEEEAEPGCYESSY